MPFTTATELAHYEREAADDGGIKSRHSYSFIQTH
jgi:hypothetical protein